MGIPIFLYFQNHHHLLNLLLLLQLPPLPTFTYSHLHHYYLLPLTPLRWLELVVVIVVPLPGLPSSLPPTGKPTTVVTIYYLLSNLIPLPTTYYLPHTHTNKQT